MRYLRGIYFWLQFWIVTTICFSISALSRFFLILRQKPFDGKAGHTAAILWGKWVVAMMPTWRVDVLDKEKLKSIPEPFVIVANHQSMSDIWIIYFLNMQFRWLSKASVFKVPLVGQAMKWAGYVPVERGNKESHKIAMEKSRDWLKKGVSMFFFPEGTRSVDGNMRTFKLGAFHLAKECHAPIVPLMLEGARDLMEKGSWIPGRAHVTIQVLDPITDVEKFDAQELANLTQEKIKSALDHFRKLRNDK